MNIYIATAYRWGWTNTDSYIVYVGTDESAANDAAEEERDSRGGKYGVEVLEYASADESKRVSYFSSTYDEKEPRANHRIAAFEQFGNRLAQAIEDDDSEALLPDPNDERRLIPTKVKIPQWIRDQYAHAVEMAKVFAPPPEAT